MEQLEPADGGYCFAALTRAELRRRPELAELAGWVDTLWYSEGALDRPRERLLPSDWVDIVLNLGAPMQLVEGSGARVLIGGTATGLLTRAAVLGHPTWHRALGMRMHVLAARAVFGPALAELTDWFVPLVDVLGADVRALIGVTPKRYARLVRFRHTLELLDAARPLAEVALAAGFGDQPHMNAEFRALAGTTPREVLVHRYSAGLTVAEDDP